MDDEKPPASRLVLKPREIIPVDKLARPGDGSAISVQLIHAQNRLAEENASRRRGEGKPPPEAIGDGPSLSPVFKPKDVVPMDPPSHAGDEEAITVAGLLSDNRIAEEEAGWGRVVHRRKRVSRRNRDFLLGVGSADLVILLLAYAAKNAVSMVYGVAAITLLTTTTAWVMFFIMDDY